MNYIILDIETTGLSRYKHKITEIAAIKYDWENILWTFQTLINPERNIPTAITHLTGITNEMVETAPKFHEICQDFLDFIQDDIIVAHNASFDYGFLSENIYTHTGNRIQNPCLCTRKLSSRLLPQLPKKNLWSLCDYFCLTNERAHRAMWDTKVTVEIFWQLLKILKNRWITQIDDILEFQNRKICDCI
jgi:DNA polymerase III epsilon subunit family exonuclease